jgi:hypothetical protein
MAVLAVSVMGVNIYINHIETLRGEVLNICVYYFNEVGSRLDKKEKGPLHTA